MTDTQQAFLRGMQKRAAELGIEKQAFVGQLIGGGLRMFGPLFASHGLTSTLPNWAANKFKGTALGSTAGFVGKQLNKPGLAGMATNIAAHSVLSPIIQKPIDYVANNFDGNGY